MPRILTHFLVFHWAVVLSLLAGVIVFGGNLPDVAGLHIFGLDSADGRLAMMALPGARALISGAFALCAIFFWWALCAGLLPSIADDRAADDVLRLAFAATAALITALLAIGTIAGVEGLFSAMAAHFAALAASFVAIRSEHLPRPSVKDEDLRNAARVKAAGASATVGLAQFTPRRDASWAGWETER